MQSVYVIATLRDLRSNWDEIAKAIMNQKVFKEVEVLGLRLVDGPGCLNLGLCLSGTEEETSRFVESLTLELMPARYSRAKDKPWTGIEGG